MDIETLNPMNADLYRVVLMLVEGFTLIVGLASVMFVLAAIICAAWDSLVEMGRSARSQMKRALRAHSHEAPGALATLEYAVDRGASGSRPALIQ